MLPDCAVSANAEGFLAKPLPRRPSATRVRCLVRAVGASLPAAIHTVREHLAKPFDRLALPCAHLVRMHLATENDPLKPGHYAIPFQSVSMILLGPGSTVSHDALRLLARQGTALVAIGEDGVRCYTAPPLIADRSGLARRQARAWANMKVRLPVARRMYAWRLGEMLPHRDVAVLRGIEGARMTGYNAGSPAEDDHSSTDAAGSPGSP